MTMQAVSFCLLHKLHILLQMGNCCSIILNAFQKFAGKNSVTYWGWPRTSLLAKVSPAELFLAALLLQVLPIPPLNMLPFTTWPWISSSLTRNCNSIFPEPLRYVRSHLGKFGLRSSLWTMSKAGLNLSAPIVTPPGVGTNLWMSFIKTYKIKFPLPVNCVSLHMTGLGPLQLHLHVWLGQTLVRGQMASRPENRGDFFISPKNSRPDLTTGVHFYHKTLGAKYLIQIHVSSTIQEDIRCIITTNINLSTNL